MNVMTLPFPPPTGERIVATNMDEFIYDCFLRDTSPTDSTTGYATAVASCHDTDIEGVVEERVVAGNDELNIQCYPYHISIL